MTTSSKPKANVNTNQLETTINDHNKAMRIDMASEITGGSRSAAITNVITIKALLALVESQCTEAQEQLLGELEKSIPTKEQLTTKYGYHMPEKQYGYSLALHDIREVLANKRSELKGGKE